jgi:predicted O-methyltransferase YrrM
MDEELAFVDDKWMRVGDTKLAYGYPSRAGGDQLAILKRRDLVEDHVGLCHRFRGGCIVELGIYRGGSTILLAELAQPRKLVAFDLSPDPVQGLTEYLDRRGLDDTVRAFYGVDQADKDTVSRVVETEFGDQPLDLVIDDASHLLEPTRASFEVLFPRLRPGGLFVIEDWNAQDLFEKGITEQLADPDSPRREVLEHRIAEALADDFVPPKPLSRLALELTLTRAISGEVVDQLHINRDWIVVTRGPADLDPASFRLADHFKDHAGLLAG